MDGGDDTPQENGSEGEVVPFPGGRHPSQWPADEEETTEPIEDVPLPFEEEHEQAAGEYEPLPEGELPEGLELLKSHEATEDDEEIGEEQPEPPPEVPAGWIEVPGLGEQPEEEEPLEVTERLSEIVPDDEAEFEDFATGAGTGDEFTREDYIRATTQEYQGLAEAIAEAANEDLELQAVAAAIPGVETGLVGFEDVTGEQPVELEPEPRGPSDLTTRVVSGVVLVALLLGALVLGGFWLWLFVTVIVMVALGEFYATVRRSGFAPVALLGLLGGIGLFVAAYLAGAGAPLAIAGALAVTSAVIAFWYAVVPRRHPLANATLTIFGVAWVAGLMAFAVPIVLAPRYQQLIVALVAATALLDMASYFVGRSVGRTQLAPSLSAQKTWEGLLGGVAAAFAFGTAISFIDWFGFDLAAGLWLAGVVSVSAPLGDLAESMVKRALNTKDMGAILPGHGGLLDRIDSLVFAVPAGYVLFLWLGYLA